MRIIALATIELVIFVLTYVCIRAGIGVKTRQERYRREAQRKKAETRQAAELIATWQVNHHSDNKMTYVVVEKIAWLPSGERHQVGSSLVVRTILSDDPTWRSSFTAAIEEAQQRAIEMNRIS